VNGYPRISDVLLYGNGYTIPTEALLFDDQFCLTAVSPKIFQDHLGYQGLSVLATRPITEAGKGHRSKEHAMFEKLNSEIAVIGIDIGKNSFHRCGFTGPVRRGRARTASRRQRAS
jgi:hypothetical protein